MKKYIIFILVLIFVFTISGCSNDIKSKPDTEPGMMGYVMDTDNGRILVVDPVAQDFSSTGGINEFYNAIWFSNVPDEVKTGDEVEVWFDVVETSYPGQSEAEHIETIQSNKPSGADLNESEALNRALASDEIDTSWPMVVKAIDYNSEDDIWEIQVGEAMSEENKIYNIMVDDKR